MTEFAIKIADVTVSVRSRFSFAEDFCKDYVVPAENVDFSVTADPLKVKAELENATEPVTEEYAECLCIYREIAEKLPLYNCAVFHGAAISFDDMAYLFTAPSGVGKSTHIKLWRKYLGQRIGIINGDKPILKLCDDKIEVCSTPWAGKEGWQKNSRASLNAVTFIKRSKVNKISQIDPHNILPQILNQIYLPQNEHAAEKTLEIADCLTKNIPFYLLECDMSEDAVKTAFETLCKQDYKEGNSL